MIVSECRAAEADLGARMGVGATHRSLAVRLVRATIPALEHSTRRPAGLGAATPARQLTAAQSRSPRRRRYQRVTPTVGMPTHANSEHLPSGSDPDSLALGCDAIRCPIVLKSGGGRVHRRVTNQRLAAVRLRRGLCRPHSLT